MKRRRACGRCCEVNETDTGPVFAGAKSRCLQSAPMDAQRITVAMADASAGYDASPHRVRLAALVDFTRDVSQFLAGERKEVDIDALDVAVVAGSIAIQTAPILAAPSLFRDLNMLLTSPLLDKLDARWRSVV